ncbi:MAG: 16S rRNA (uracil(1498)-N(3))-methyltransferase [Clostridiales bacterium]|nr:16S rRNA (uracil(1498)-N(3))-methyltransferase [Clostridiales bacterium]
MPRFFSETIAELPALEGADAAHIVKALRMRPGERLTVCDLKGTDYFCEIAAADPQRVELTVLETAPTKSEPKLAVTLYQCVPKGDKLDGVVQKAVELGVSRIVPVLSSRCVSRPDPKSMGKKTDRWRKIAREAAGQSGRGVLPAVDPALDFNACAAALSGYDLSLFFYEEGGEPLRTLVSRTALPPSGGRAAVLIGPEGGFTPEEARKAASAGAATVTLGPRILRTETAPIAALTALMLLTGNLE